MQSNTSLQAAPVRADLWIYDIENRSGIYSLLNRTTGKQYIGSASKLRVRKNTHLHHLRKGTHDNKHLQRSFNRHGEEDFVFQVLEYCDRDDLTVREQHWLDQFSEIWEQLYNIRRVADLNTGVSTPHTAETRAKMSRSKKGITPSNHSEALALAHRSHQQPILEHDGQGTNLKRYSSIKEAAEQTGIFRETIAQACTRGHRVKSSGTYFKRLPKNATES